MVTPVFRILEYSKALEFYVDWLGFRIDWADLPDQEPVYAQVSRGDIVLHLSGHQSDGCPGAKARAEILGLPAYHHQLLHKNHTYSRPGLSAANWNERVLEMEVVDPFGNRLVFCEPSGLQVH